MALDEIGIVVIGRNEGQRLIDCFTSLADAKSRGATIVYANSGSTDGSLEERCCGQAGPSRPFTAARGRNEGFKALKARKPRCSVYREHDILRWRGID
jgi:hypothetical protein